MTELAKIQSAVEQLPEPELRKFQAWFAELRARQWDDQIDRDLAAGKLDERAEKWRADHWAGKSTDIP